MFCHSVTSDSRIEVLTGGKVDRIDVVGGVTRIVDYKTGTVADTINSIGDLFVDDRKRMLTDGFRHCSIAKHIWQIIREPVRPSVYKIRKLTGASSVTINSKLRLTIKMKL